MTKQPDPDPPQNVKDANYALSTKSNAILDSVPEASKSQGEELIEKLKTGVASLDTAVEAKDKEAVWSTRRELLNNITALEELMVVGFPFNVPPEYANLPQLRGRVRRRFRESGHVAARRAGRGVARLSLSVAGPGPRCPGPAMIRPR